jgi:hypothetical protein
MQDNIISLSEMAKLKRTQEELATKSAELDKMRNDFNAYKTQAAMIISVGEIWKLQLNDLILNLETLQASINGLLGNTITLRNKLPNFELPKE